MRPLRLFISSVQKEFAEDRAALRDYLRGDVLLRRFFDPFLFEEIPAADRRADDVYLDEVKRCDLYVGLFGYEYGSEDADGLSSTQKEFDLASRLHKHRLIFVKGADEARRHPKMPALICTFRRWCRRNPYGYGMIWSHFRFPRQCLGNLSRQFPRQCLGNS